MNKAIKAAAAAASLFYLILPVVILYNVIKIKQELQHPAEAPPVQHDTKQINQETEQLIKQFREESRKQDEKIQELLKQAEQ